MAFRLPESFHRWGLRLFARRPFAQQQGRVDRQGADQTPLLRQRHVRRPASARLRGRSSFRQARSRRDQMAWRASRARRGARLRGVARGKRLEKWPPLLLLCLACQVVRVVPRGTRDRRPPQSTRGTNYKAPANRRELAERISANARRRPADSDVPRARRAGSARTSRRSLVDKLDWNLDIGVQALVHGAMAGGGFQLGAVGGGKSRGFLGGYDNRYRELAD